MLRKYPTRQRARCVGWEFEAARQHGAASALVSHQRRPAHLRKLQQPGQQLLLLAAAIHHSHQVCALEEVDQRLDQPTAEELEGRDAVGTAVR